MPARAIRNSLAPDRAFSRSSAMRKWKRAAAVAARRERDDRRGLLWEFCMLEEGRFCVWGADACVRGRRNLCLVESDILMFVELVRLWSSISDIVDIRSLPRLVIIRFNSGAHLVELEI